MDLGGSSLAVACGGWAGFGKVGVGVVWLRRFMSFSLMRLVCSGASTAEQESQVAVQGHLGSGRQGAAIAQRLRRFDLL